ncbi:MAG: RDD family protein [Acidimicrobiales bacterium]
MTAEGVVLAMHPAGITARLAAGLIDLAALYALFNILSAVLVAVLATLGSTPFAVGGAVVGGVVVLAYPVAQETLWNGKTLGKAALGLRVVSLRGGPIGFRQAAVRGALLLVDASPLLVPWTAAMVLSSRRRRLGDLAAGTVVVRERRGDDRRLRAIAFDPPPPLLAYRDRLDVSGLDPAGYRLIRSVLLRVHELDPVARRALTERCADAMVARLQAPPPRWYRSVAMAPAWPCRRSTSCCAWRPPTSSATVERPGSVGQR